MIRFYLLPGLYLPWLDRDLDWVVIELDEVSSTQDDLRNRISGKIFPQDTLLCVQARRQTKGRGRHGRVWTTGEDGNLAFSFMVEKPSNYESLGALSMLSGLAVFDAVQPYISAGDMVLKWPNDVLIDGGKVSGILLEVEGDYVLIGIGVNVVSVPEAEKAACALCSFCNELPECSGVRAEILSAFSDLYDHYQAEGFDVLREMWQARSFDVGTRMSVKLPGGTQDGLYEGVDPQGNLLLRGADNGLVTVRSGDVYLS